MKIFYKYRFILPLCFVLLNLSCTDKNEEIKQKAKIKPSLIEEIFYIDTVFQKNEKKYAILDIINYTISVDSSNLNKSDIIKFPNGYSILNEKVEFMEQIISDSVDITMQTLNYDDYGNFNFNEKIDSDNFEQIYLNPEYERYKHIPFKITLVDNQITSITEIYIP